MSQNFRISVAVMLLKTIMGFNADIMINFLRKKESYSTYTYSVG